MLATPTPDLMAPVVEDLTGAPQSMLVGSLEVETGVFIPPTISYGFL